MQCALRLAQDKLANAVDACIAARIKIKQKTPTHGRGLQKIFLLLICLEWEQVLQGLYLLQDVAEPADWLVLSPGYLSHLYRQYQK